MSHMRNWNFLPHSLLLKIFSYLPPLEVARIRRVSITWDEVSRDNLLWRFLFKGFWKANINVPPHRHTYQTNWEEEFKTLYLDSPTQLSETLTSHTDEVLHVSFSNNGLYFATCSKDATVRLWDSTNCEQRHCANLNSLFYWQYTQFSQFNTSDSLLLVSGAHFGPHSISGEIAVFDVEAFVLQSRVLNKPYDVFGCWLYDDTVLSGILYPRSGLTSCSGLWLNKAYQYTDNESQPVVKLLYRFLNYGASTVRMIKICDLPSRNESEREIQTNDNIENIAKRTKLDGSTQSNDNNPNRTKLLIFTAGNRTYIPHLIAFKRVDESRTAIDPITDTAVEPSDDDSVPPEFDEADRLIDLEGHILGLAVSPDCRFLYCNVRSWPRGTQISDPLVPPPIAREIELRCFDLLDFSQLDSELPIHGHVGHRANDECFFIHPEVSHDLVASGSEDRVGYVWHRRYKCVVSQLSHRSVVNCVAFNPREPGMLVSVSDDNTIKVWRSRSSLETCASN